MNDPAHALTRLDAGLFARLLAAAELSPRKRAHDSLHATSGSLVQKTCAALVSGTYIRPHCHHQPHKHKLLLPLMGEAGVLIFDAQGIVLERLTLSPDHELRGVDLPPGVWHTVFPLTHAAVVLDIKQGPCAPPNPVCFAAWAPEEHGRAVPEFLKWAVSAGIGERFAVHGPHAPGLPAPGCP